MFTTKKSLCLCLPLVFTFMATLSIINFASGQNNRPKAMPVYSSHRLAGKELKAFMVGYEAFTKSPDLAEAKKNLENYDIEIREDNTSYFVHFHVKQIDLKNVSSVATVGGENAFGREEQFTVSKSDYRITSKLLYR